LKDFSLQFLLTILVTPDDVLSGLSKKPGISIISKLNDLNVNFTPFIYEQLINIGKTLALENSVAQMLKTDKQIIMKTSKKIDSVYCFTNSQIAFKKYYAALASAYLYFYETNKQPYPTAYFYIDNAVIKKLGYIEKSGLFEFIVFLVISKKID